MLFCIPFALPITNPYAFCIPSLKSLRPLSNMLVWLISSGNLIGLGAWEVIWIWTVWLARQKMYSDKSNSCYILAAAQTENWLRSAVCPSSYVPKKAIVARKLKCLMLDLVFFVTNHSFDALSADVESCSFLSKKGHAARSADVNPNSATIC